MVMYYLKYNYRKVCSKEVTQKETEVIAITWQPQDPMVLLTWPTENLQKLVIQAGLPYSDNQLLEKGLTIICNTRDFEHALTMWEDLP